ncbi:dihydroorotate dehydrogenase [Irpex rosettiformis]|uniref:Dihydroorotate dehydrogenase n=1 Tax=Irpex rosettiformis TaxID=378272 RepID=A0ACB8TUU0_9APHY|nr:dihydroorotate dehydrogenase [Irpex rosettiformis]
MTTSTTASGSNAVRNGLYATVFVVSTGLFAAYYFDCRSAIHRYVLTPIVRYTLDPETGHKFAVKVLRSGLSPRDTQKDDETLGLNLWGTQLSNPVGLAAGFDKNGEAVDGLFNLGFSWVEIGSVTPKPQDGNPKPRMFRLSEDEAVINRYGFPSEGHVSVLNRLLARIPKFHQPNPEENASLHTDALLAVNLGKNKSSPPDSIDDFVAGVRAFAPHADVLVVNVSSPNTPGLRGMQSRSLLQELLSGVLKARDDVVSAHSLTQKPKLVLKIAPDLTEDEIADVAAAVRNSGVDGVVVSNTTIKRPDSLLSSNKIETGGLSGPPLKPYSLAALRTLRALLPAEVPIFGCGGIASGADALEYARAGATAVQIYTSFGYDGVGTCRRIKDELVEELKKEGTTWAEVVSRAVAEKSFKEPPPPEPVKPGEGSVAQLIEEAEELKKLLDAFGDRFAGGLTDETPVVSATGGIP